jgi:hypothetical protein
MKKIIFFCFILFFQLINNQVTISNLISMNGILSSLTVTFTQTVSNFSPRQIIFQSPKGALSNALGSTYSKTSNTIYQLSSSNGFGLSENGTYSIYFKNDPPQLCTPQITEVITTTPKSVVGTGTPSSCTELAFATAFVRTYS